MKFWCDIETTGLDETVDDVHQIAAICDNEIFNIHLVYNEEMVSHDLPIPQDVVRYPQDVGYAMFIDFVKKCFDKHGELLFSGKNPNFDWGFLSYDVYDLFFYNLQDWFKYYLFDLQSVIIMQKDLGYISQDQSTKLEELAKLFGMKHTPHDGLSDIIITKIIYEDILY